MVEPCLANLPGARPDTAQLAEALRALKVEGPGLREHLGLPNVPPVPTRPDTNLPEDGDAFVGRADALRWLAEALARPGPATLVGPPGIGKSRLAVEAARRLRSTRPEVRAWIESSCLANLGDHLALQGRVDEGAGYLEAALQIARDRGYPRMGGWAAGRLGLIRLRSGMDTEAAANFQEAEEAFARVGERELLAKLLVDRAELAWDGGDREQARAWVEHADTLGQLAEAREGVARMRARMSESG